MAIDAFKNAAVVVCGHGKPSARRIKDALLSHIALGSTIVHDMEKSHRALVNEAGCTDEAYFMVENAYMRLAVRSWQRQRGPGDATVPERLSH